MNFLKRWILEYRNRNVKTYNIQLVHDINGKDTLLVEIDIISRTQGEAMDIALYQIDQYNKEKKTNFQIDNIWKIKKDYSIKTNGVKTYFTELTEENRKNLLKAQNFETMDWNIRSTPLINKTKRRHLRIVK